MGEAAKVKKKDDGKSVVTPVFRVSFPQVFEPKSFEGQKAKYSIVCLWPKDTDLTAVKKAVSSAIIEKWGADKEKWPKKLKRPFRDGSEREDVQGYKGMVFLTATSNTQPGLVDQNRQPIIDQKKFYAGCYARAELRAFAFDVSGNKGVSFAVQNIQFAKDGDPFSGRSKPEDVFDKIADDSEDEDNYSSDDKDSDDDSEYDDI